MSNDLRVGLPYNNNTNKNIIATLYYVASKAWENELQIFAVNSIFILENLLINNTSEI
jgi:hypothetical protein